MSLWDWLTGKTKYRYTVLRYEPRLGGESTSVAVIAERRQEEGTLWLVMGREPDTSAASQMGTRILEQLPDWLEAQLREAIEESEDPLRYLASNHPFNLSFARPRERKASEFTFDVAKLFAVEVLGIDDPRVVVQRKEHVGTLPDALGAHASKLPPEPDFSFLEVPGITGRRSERPRTPA